MLQLSSFLSGKQYHLLACAAGSDSDKIMDTPVQQEIPQSHARQYTTPPMQPGYTPDPSQYNSMGSTSMSMSMRPNSPEMPTILETNSQASPESHMQYASTPHHGSQSTWNPTNSWLPTSGPGAPSMGGALTGTSLCCSQAKALVQVSAWCNRQDFALYNPAGFCIPYRVPPDKDAVVCWHA